MTSAEQAYVFRHAVLRDAAYQLQPVAERAKLHRLVVDIAEALWGLPPPHGLKDSAIKGLAFPADPLADELCGHLEVMVAFAAGQPDEKILRARLSLYLRRAAQLAHARFENERVARLYERLAVEFADETGCATVDLLRAATAASFDNIRHAGALCLRALEAARGTPVEGLALRDLARIHILCGHNQAGREAANKALSLLRAAGDSENEVVVLTLLAVASIKEDEPAKAERSLERALEAARNYGLRGHEWLNLVNYSDLLGQAGREPEAEQILRNLVEPGPGQADPDYRAVAHGNLAEMLAARGDSAEAERHFRLSLDCHRRQGNRVQEGWICAQLARLLLGAGRLDEAQTLLVAAEEVLERIGHTVWLGGLRGWHAQIMLARGQVEQSERTFIDALSLQRKHAEKFVPIMLERMNNARARAGLQPRSWPTVDEPGQGAA